MKKAFTLLCMAGFFLSARAQVNYTPATRGNVFVLTDTVYDFGRIPQGRPVSHVFDINNQGTDTLQIDNVQASCGCTTPQWERNKKVAPGATTQIIIGYNAANAGAFTKNITVTYNRSQTKVITIKGEVWKTPPTSAPENNEVQHLKNQ